MRRNLKRRDRGAIRWIATGVAQITVAIAITASVGLWMVAVAVIAGGLVACAFALMIVTGGLFARRPALYVDTRPSAKIIPIGI